MFGFKRELEFERRLAHLEKLAQAAECKRGDTLRWLFKKIAADFYL